MTPVMEQYQKLKEKNPGCILFFRLGDFYEMFSEDAKTVAPILGLALTKKGDDPMCGVPCHSYLMYIDRLLQKGFKVAVSEQDAEGGSRKLMSRSIVRIYTPGTRMEEELLKNEDENFIASVVRRKSGRFELALCDVSRGLLYYKISSNLDDLDYEMFIRNVCETIVLDDDYYGEDGEMRRHIDRFGKDVNKYPASVLSREWTDRELKTKLGTNTLDALDGYSSVWNAICLLIRFLKEISLFDSIDFTEIRSIESLDYLFMPKSTIQALELVSSNLFSRSGSSLYSVINCTVTAMGGRMLRKQILAPLTCKQQIEDRLGKVEWFVANSDKRAEARMLLRNVSDVERGAHRLGMRTIKKQELLNIAKSIESSRALFATDSRFYECFFNKDTPVVLQRLFELANLIDRAVEGNPESAKLIKSGYDPQLDALREKTDFGDKLFLDYINRKKAECELQNIRLVYSRAFGYSMEVSKSQIARVPQDWTVRQSLVNATRYVNDEFLGIERDVVGAKSRENEREDEVYKAVCATAASMQCDIVLLSSVIGNIDMVSSLAECAVIHNYSRPEITEDNSLEIVAGRHPVVEDSSDEDFVANDLSLNGNGTTLCLLTGPNMVGKSTYLRQNALIVILAQIGSFVPAASARIGITDKIFSRIGSGDNIAEGESTFYTEMKEAAFIVRNCTGRSFVIMDEIGRGTSATDGCAIADSIMRYMAQKRINCLFATHYLELAANAGLYPNVRNITLSVDERGKTVIFLRKIIDGIASSSYASHAARLAGLPQEIISTAEKLKHSHKDGSLFDLVETTGCQDEVPKSEADAALAEKYRHLADELNDFDINSSTPLDALNFLGKIKNSLND